MKILVLISGMVALCLAATPQQQEHHLLVQELRKTFKQFDVSHLGYLPLSDFLAYYDRLTKGFTGTLNLDAYTKLMHLPPDIASFYFKYYDMNDDGELTKDIDIRAVFHMFDRDHNGRVSEHEFVAEAVKIHQEMAKHVSVVSLEFVGIDGNSDGFITVSDFQKFFDIYDHNRDGHINLAEFTKATDLDPAIAAKVFRFEDSDNDGILDRQTDVQALFSRYDTNHDGKLDYHEYRIYANKLRSFFTVPVGK